MSADPMLVVVQGASGTIDLVRLPAAQQIVDGAIRALSTDRRLLGCKHVLDGEPDIRACASHPLAGVMCRPCYGRHIGRHDTTEEHRCDGCGRVVDDIHGAVQVVHCAPWATVRDTRGRRRALPPVFLLGGIGACGPCLAGAVTPVEAASDQGGPS